MTPKEQQELLEARLIALSAECYQDACELARTWGIDIHARDFYDRAYAAKRAALASGKEAAWTSVVVSTDPTRVISATRDGEQVDPERVKLEETPGGNVVASIREVPHGHGMTNAGSGGPWFIKDAEAGRVDLPNGGRVTFAEPVCPDCNNTREYVGLTDRGPCRTCSAQGGE